MNDETTQKTDFAPMIEDWRKIMDNHFSQIKSFLGSAEIKQIAEEYAQANAENTELGFNIFSVVSDYYYRENFHSDFLANVLDPKGAHKQKHLFLDIFIDVLNKLGKCIVKSDYVDAEVVREEGRIDILIKSKSSKKAIIIENKINNAGDQYRQLPRYYDYVISNGFIVDAIVYLPLAENKQPDEGTWTEEDKQNVHKHLVHLPAFCKGTKINLTTDWTEVAALKTTDILCHANLKQYAELVKYLSHNNMDNIILEKLFSELMVGENLKTAISIKASLEEMPKYMASRLMDYFVTRNLPLRKQPWIYNGIVAVLDFQDYSGQQLAIDIQCSLDGYFLTFFNRTDKQLPENMLSLPVIAELKYNEHWG
ncbi:MAG: PD-(D/E)XK nuclease family protein, partial [Bacteroidaceae bacterium]|nr:PD-(D/E)XK nuclease family protein [Bacteroidaceae bacterium]